MTTDALGELVRRAIAGDRAAVQEVVATIQDDVYHLALRMLGERAAAEDATQEVLIQVITHLAQWRGDSSLRTWVWRIATRHVLRARKTANEEACSFDAIEMLITEGAGEPALPALAEAELAVLEEELRLACTEGMLLSLDRDHRIAWILSETFELPSEHAAVVLEIEPAALRKRVSRARERLGTWMNAHCGLVNAVNACCCRRQIPVALKYGAIDLTRHEFAGHPERREPQRKRLTLAAQADEVERAKEVLCSCPDYAAPEAMTARLRELIDSGSVRLFNA